MPPPDPTDPVAFAGTERFAVLDQLGVGGMCVVYRARDREHGDVVALKTLRHLDPGSLYRLKQEFRALSHLDHPNLVSFYELVHEQGDWFVTMELVEGVDFLSWCRGAEDAARSRERSEHTWKSSQDLRFARSVPAGRAATRDNQVTEAYAPAPDGRPPDVLRLRSSLRQLAEGLQTLHDLGRVHRDLKPSNVLVTQAGRVVILDFGLVAEIDQDYTEGTLHQNIAGSAAYMSPEQSVGKSLTAASDWYSVGVMLYEALTGVWPYSGHLYKILTAKQEHDPIPPRELVGDVPPDLDDLCMALLRREPGARPSGPEILERLRTRRPVLPASRAPASATFRFRERELDELGKALQAAAWGRSVVALVRGAPGIGKSALVRELVKSARRAERVTVLKGRCYRWEQLRYEALDGVMDNLSRVLRRTDAAVLRELEGPTLDRLAGLFPVIGRVREIDVDPVPAAEGDARDALVEVLRALAASGPIVISIDDVHHGDRDSAVLLGEALASAPDLPVLLVLAYPPELPGPFVGALLATAQAADLDVRAIDLEPLPIDQAEVVALELLGADAAEAARAVAWESAGNPAAIRELARRATRGRRPVVEVNEVVTTRIAELPDAPARLLAVLALAGGPVPTGVALTAAALGPSAFSAITTLRALQLVHAEADDTAEGTLEVAGEPLREHVIDQLPDEERRRMHLALARSLEDVGAAAPEALVEHYAAGGEPARAAIVAWQAAETAARSRSWDGAAWLLDRALELGRWSGRERQSLSGQLGTALAMIGRGAEAARRFLEAAEEAPRLRRGPLRLLAAEQLLASGHVDRGVPLLASVLGELGLRGLPPASCVGPLTRWRRWRLAWRGKRYSARSPAEVDAAQLHRVDALWTAAELLATFDPPLGACVQPLHLRAALDVGEVERVARALAAEARWRGTEEPGGPRWREAWSEARSTAEGVGSALGVARAVAAAGLAAYHGGLWSEAIRLGAEADAALSDAGAPAWERLRVRIIVARCRLWIGELRAAAALAAELADEVERADNVLYGALLAGSVLPTIRMAEDDPDTGVREVEAALGRWSRAGFHVPHAWALLARVRLDLYRGRASYAWERLQEQWRPMIRSGVLVDPVLRSEAWLARATCAVAATSQRVAVGREVHAALRQVRREDQAWAQPWATLLEAAASRAAGGDPWERLAEAQRGFEQQGMAFAAAVATGARAAREGGEPDARWLRGQGVRDPERLASAFAPGLWTTR